ncbi:hypothetical protein C8F01DRAFT_1243956 [Mycena amicta]|nr:hypothetical protein C8F01DRAFT_1243956 [Mycena amicta]
MALPPQFTTRDISGRFILNSKLSDTQDTFLPIAVSTQLLRAKLAFNHYTDENGSERICVEQEVSVGGRVASVSEDNRILDWCERPLEDPLFGRVVGRIRRIKTPLLKPPFLRAGWTADTRKHGVLQYDLCDDRHTWATDETWGIEEIAGERYFARHVRFTPGLGAEDVERRFVYDYVGSI